MPAIVRPKNVFKPLTEKKDRSYEADHLFVVHRHDARTLHYDLRLEINGVLKCWAIPEGPSLNPNDRRLAIMVHDRPLSYAYFKGRIPEGSDESGTVEIWDKGVFRPAGFLMGDKQDRRMLRQLKDGNLTFVLKGKILNGSFRLLRLKSKNDNLWLLIKGNDGFAVDHVFNSEDFVTTSFK
jgi:bifunctional non-homologous end joining protein LigD